MLALSGPADTPPSPQCVHFGDLVSRPRYAMEVILIVDRRTFNTGVASAVAAAALGSIGAPAKAAYRGPNVIIVRFGGGVRRAETIVEATTYAPYLINTFAKRGVLLPNMRIANIKGMDTSHAEGTINILTGRYGAWRDAGSAFLLRKIEPTAPTLFEYLRKAFDIAPHEALLVNGEDRPQEEYFSFARHSQFGGDFRAEVLSLYRYKRWLYGQLLTQSNRDEKLLREIGKRLTKLERHELPGRAPQRNASLEKFWAGWRRDYRDHGLVNPRGDRLLTELALRAMRELRPRLMMINYQDPDYVHWGNASHYTRAIAIIDQSLRQLVEAADRLDHYARQTVFVVVPDCGRDANPLMGVPFQHHFNTKSAHEIWALIAGPGIVKGKVLDKTADQSQIAATIGAAMGFRAQHAEAEAIAEVFV